MPTWSPTWTSISRPGLILYDRCSNLSSKRKPTFRSVLALPQVRSSSEVFSVSSFRGSTTSSLADFFDIQSVTLSVASRQSGPTLPETLIPRIEDDSWFFDTELLVLAWRDGLRINEVPVYWVEDDDSRVRIMRTAFDDLRGIWRLSRSGVRRGSALRNRPLADHPETSASLGAKEEEQAVDFDSYANQYEDLVDESVSFTGRNSAFYAGRKVDILEEIVSAGIGPLEELSVLDVGCGTGTTDQLLVSRVGSLHGVDISEEMLAQARASVPDAEYRWYDGEKLPFPDETFEVVVAICVLHHVPLSSRYKFVSEMVRVARSGGIVAIFEHNPVNPLTRHAVNSCQLDQDAVLLRSRETMGLLKEATDVEPLLRHYLFSPIGGVIGRAIDRHLHRLPLGGQYASWVQRPY